MNDLATDSGEQARRLLENIRALVRRFSLAERADMSCCGMTVAQAATLEPPAPSPAISPVSRAGGWWSEKPTPPMGAPSG